MLKKYLKLLEYCKFVRINIEKHSKWNQDEERRMQDHPNYDIPKKLLMTHANFWNLFCDFSPGWGQRVKDFWILKLSKENDDGLGT